LVNGYVEQWGYGIFTGRVLGGEETSGLTRYTLEGNKIDGVWHYTSDEIIHLDGGRLIKMSAEWDGGAFIIYRGVLLDPPGGESRMGPKRRMKSQ